MKSLTCSTKQALFWITNILQKHRIPFQIAGGLAARAYGSTRPLIDIDIDIPEADFKKIHQEVQPYITYGPSKFINENWDLMLMTLCYKGQDIDISGAHDAKLRDCVTSPWTKIDTDFSSVKSLIIEDMTLPVIDYQALIAYKRLCKRPVDLQDIHELESLKEKLS